MQHCQVDDIRLASLCICNAACRVSRRFVTCSHSTGGLRHTYPLKEPGGGAHAHRMGNPHWNGHHRDNLLYNIGSSRAGLNNNRIREPSSGREPAASAPSSGREPATTDARDDETPVTKSVTEGVDPRRISGTPQTQETNR